jgi:hypothetical protein
MTVLTCGYTEGLEWAQMPLAIDLDIARAGAVVMVTVAVLAVLGAVLLYRRLASSRSSGFKLVASDAAGTSPGAEGVATSSATARRPLRGRS